MGFWKQLISDVDGNYSSMRVALLYVVLVCSVVVFAIVFCMIYMTVKHGRFPDGAWSAIASVAGTVGSVAAAKMRQTGYESSIYSITKNASPSPPPPVIGSEKE